MGKIQKLNGEVSNRKNRNEKCLREVLWVFVNNRSWWAVLELLLALSSIWNCSASRSGF